MNIQMIVWIAAGYLLGSIRFGYLLPRHISHVDVTALSPDGNPGAANAFKYGGRLVGALALLGDLAKGFLPVSCALAAEQAGGPPPALLTALVIAAPVAGHAWPAGHWKKGGKAIAVSFGVLLGLLPVWTPLAVLASYYLLFSLVFIITPHLHRSIVTFSLFALTVLLMVPLKGVVLGCILISGIVVWKHAASDQGEKLQYRPVWKSRR